MGVAVSIIEVGAGVAADSTEGAADSITSTVEPRGRIAVAASEQVVYDTGFTAVRTLDFAPSSDVVEGMSKAVLTFSYDGAALTEEEIAGLGVYYYDRETWQFVGGELDTAARTVSAPIDHFSTYGLLVDRNAVAARRIKSQQLYTIGRGNIRSLPKGGVEVEFRLSHEQHVEIAVYTAGERLMGYIVRGTLPPGVHRKCFSTPSSAGVVLVVIRGGNGILAKHTGVYH